MPVTRPLDFTEAEARSFISKRSKEHSGPTGDPLTVLEQVVREKGAMLITLGGDGQWSVGGKRHLATAPTLPLAIKRAGCMAMKDMEVVP